MRRKRTFGGVFGLVLALLLLAAAPTASAVVWERTNLTQAEKKAQTTEVQLLAINDFHGNLNPIPATSSSGRIGTVPAGGAEYLATHIRALEATNPNTLVVSAGDLIGASPLISGLFHDEPTIEAANAFGLDFNAVGNHEFDEGATELVRMQEGGCHPVDGCLDGDPFGGAAFDFLAANVRWQETGETLFPPYEIVHFPGVKVALIGMTLEGTPSIVTPSGVQGLDFLDEADTVNALVPALKKRGVETIVVLIHEGGFPVGSYNECPGISGPIVDIVNRTSDEVDFFVTGHTHQAYNCILDGRPVTSAASFGRLVTDIDLTISRATKEPVRMTIDNKIVTRGVAKDTAQTALIEKYTALSAPIANRVVGSITADITRATAASGETRLGNLIADAQLAATSPASLGGAEIAFMNQFGMRADLDYEQSSGGEGPGQVTYGEIFTVQPFANNLVTMTVTGAQIDRLLETQFTGGIGMLQISSGFEYTWSASAPAGEKVDAASIKLNGVPLDPAGSYRITVNNFLADGGDRYTVLREGTNRLGGVVDTDALEAYISANSPVAPPELGRITRVG